MTSVLGKKNIGGIPGALVIGTNLRALGIARSLGRWGVQTWLLHEPGDDVVARASRYVRRTLAAPGGTPVEQSDRLRDLALRHRLQDWVLFATDDQAVAALTQEHGALSRTFHVTFPTWQVFLHAYRKRFMHAIAEQTGVPHPWTRYPRTAEEVAALPCEFPVILKPDVKPEENSFTRAKAWRVEDRASLVAAWKEAASLVGAEAVMVQELIPGSGASQYSFAALCRQGVPLATLVARRTRQYPRDFGHSSSLVETVEAPAVEELGRAVVEALGWTGLVEVEFKYDARDCLFKLLDVNGRVWTWHALGPRAGVDFPYLAWRLAQGLQVGTIRARPGVRWVRLATDIPSALDAVRAGELSVRDWIESVRGPRQGALFALDDPLPSLLDPPLLAWRSVRRRIQLTDERRRAELSAGRTPWLDS